MKDDRASRDFSAWEFKRTVTKLVHESCDDCTSSLSNFQAVVLTTKGIMTLCGEYCPLRLCNGALMPKNQPKKELSAEN